MARQKTTYPAVFHRAAHLLIVLIIFIFLKVASEVLIPIALAILLALLLTPLCSFFEKNGFSRVLAILMTLLLLFLFLSLLVFVLSAQLYSFTSSLPLLIDKVNFYFDELEWYLFKNFNIQLEGREAIFQDYIKDFMNSGVLLVTGTISTFLGILKFVGLVPIYIFLLLLYRNSFKDFFLIITPVERHRTVKRVTTQIQKVVQSYIVGLFTVILIIGVLNSLSLFAIGVEYAIFFGFLAALLNIIPYIGVFIGSLIPTVYVLITHNSIWHAVAVVVAFGVIQFLEGNFITPNITGNKVKVNALAAILALVVGGYIWGVAGLILFLPYIAMLKIVFENIPGLKPVAFLLGTEIYGENGAAARRKRFIISGFSSKEEEDK